MGQNLLSPGYDERRLPIIGRPRGALSAVFMSVVRKNCLAQ